MATRHILECPNCHHELLIDYAGAVGGVVQDVLQLIDSRAKVTDEGAAGTPVDTFDGATRALAPDGTQTVASTAVATTSGEVNATPGAVEHADATGVDLSTVQGSGADGKITKPDVQAAADAMPPPATDAAAAHAEATGVDLNTVEGTGKDGTITKADVVNATPAEPVEPVV